MGLGYLSDVDRDQGLPAAHTNPCQTTSYHQGETALGEVNKGPRKDREKSKGEHGRLAAHAVHEGPTRERRQERAKEEGVHDQGLFGLGEAASLPAAVASG